MRTRLDLRDTITEILKSDAGDGYDGAGFIILRWVDGEPMMLCLRSEDNLDIPKGSRDPGEMSPAVTAMRELSEEVSITSFHVIRGSGICRIRDLILFLATTDQEPRIRPNPTTGKVEHDGIVWVNFDEAEKSVYDFLVPGVRWARDVTKSLVRPI